MANPVAEIESKTGKKQCFGREFEKVLLHFSEWTDIKLLFVWRELQGAIR
jgi:hypothetical protein